MLVSCVLRACLRGGTYRGIHSEEGKSGEDQDGDSPGGELVLAILVDFESSFDESSGDGVHVG